MRLATTGSVIAAMGLHMAMIGHRIEQAKHMLAGLRVEAINQHRVRSPVIGSKLKLGIVDHDVAIGS